MPHHHKHSEQKTKFDSTLFNDVFHTLKKDLAEIYDFYLDQEAKNRLARMDKVKRWINMSIWLFKSMFNKLTTARRMLLLAACVLAFMSNRFAWSGNNYNVSVDFSIFSFFIVLVILMLELKDKLLAHEELDAGRAVQKALMPERTPYVPGWELWLFTRSANEVGGDLIDFVQLDGKRFGVALGDVAGKGLRAALLTAKLQATLSAVVQDFESLGKLGKKMNRIFFRNRLPNVFASLVYLEIQPGSGLVKVLNAGHFEPVCLREADAERMKKGGPALGIVANASYAEQRIRLRRGDRLVVYSDGLTEARNGNGDFFGEDRMTDLLKRSGNCSAPEIGEMLVREVDQFLGETRANDDLSIVVLKKA